MSGLKLVDASEVVTSKKTSKIEIKKVSKSSMKIITGDSQKNAAGGAYRDSTVAGPNVLKSDIIERSNVLKSCVITKADIDNKKIRAIKLKQDIYYGPKNVNKNKFVRMYKKLKLVWRTDNIDGMMVDGWFNGDKSQYIIKLMEDGDFKRFKFYGCDEIYDYFVDLGGVVFDHNKEDSLSSNYNNNKINNAVGIKESAIGISGKDDNIVGIVSGDDNISSGISNRDTDEIYRFIGADLWSSYRTRQLLKNMPDDWGIVWK
jgi:hypothetical protein